MTQEQHEYIEALNKGWKYFYELMQVGKGYSTDPQDEDSVLDGLDTSQAEMSFTVPEMTQQEEDEFYGKYDFYELYDRWDKSMRGM